MKVTSSRYTDIKAELLGHLDYLNQTQYIKAEFTAYANQEDVPSAVEAKEFDFRVANSFGAADGLCLT